MRISEEFGERTEYNNKILYEAWKVLIEKEFQKPHYLIKNISRNMALPAYYIINPMIWDSK